MISRWIKIFIRILIVGLILIVAFFTIAFIGFHNSEDKCDFDSFELCKNFQGNPFPGDINVMEIRLCESKLERDTVKMDFVLPEFEFENHVCSFLFPDEYKVLGIERNTEYCATIFAVDSDTLVQSQFLKLSDLKRIQSKKLELVNKTILKNAILNPQNKEPLSQYTINKSLFDRVLSSDCLFYYAQSELVNDTRDFYNSVSKNRLKESIIREVQSICELDRDWNCEQEEKNWGLYVDKYNVGDFTNQERIYNVDKFSETLKVTLLKNNEVMIKYFVFAIQVGN